MNELKIRGFCFKDGHFWIDVKTGVTEQGDNVCDLVEWHSMSTETSLEDYKESINIVNKELLKIYKLLK